MKRFLVLLLTLLAVSCGAAPPGPPQPNAVANALNSTVVLLRDGFKDGDLTVTCAGEFIEPHLMVTAYHCLDNLTGCPEDDRACYQSHEVGYVTHTDYAAESFVPRIGNVVASEPRYDLALIRTVEKSNYFVGVEIAPPAAGQEVFAIGHPHSNPFVISRGFVKNTLKFTPEPSVECSLEIGPGSSGGGLYDGNGQLIGVVHSMSNDGTTAYATLGFALAELTTRK